jgi:hypothetical protein
MSRSSKLRKGQVASNVAERRKRLQTILNMRSAPESIVIMMAEGYLRSFRWSWRLTWDDFKIKLPHWLFWILSSDYRAVCREPDPDFEDRMRGLFGETHV